MRSPLKIPDSKSGVLELDLQTARELNGKNPTLREVFATLHL